MHKTDQKDGRFKIGRFLIQFALIICGLALLVSKPHLIQVIRANELSPEWLLVGPCIFLSLFLIDLAYELTLQQFRFMSVSDYFRPFFGLLIIALSFPSSMREYNARQFHDPMSVSLIEKFSEHKDARIRALALLASSRHKFDQPSFGALIHKGLLDKDPLVQQAAKLVIEDNFSIRLQNGAEGIHQAQSFINDVSSSALLRKKGAP